VLADSFVLHLTRKHVCQANIVRLVDESGHTARTYFIDDDLVLKTQRPSQICPETSLGKEVAILTHLHSDPEILVPAVLGYGTESGTEYTLMRRIPGMAARQLALADESRKTVLPQLGQTLRRIHQRTRMKFGDSEHFSAAIREPEVSGHQA
jgi:aminoglycoside phosphotransferase